MIGPAWEAQFTNKEQVQTVLLDTLYSICDLQDTLRTDEQEVNHHGRSVSVAAGNSVQPEVQ